MERRAYLHTNWLDLFCDLWYNSNTCINFGHLGYEEGGRQWRGGGSTGWGGERRRAAATPRRKNEEEEEEEEEKEEEEEEEEEKEEEEEEEEEVLIMAIYTYVYAWDDYKKHKAYQTRSLFIFSDALYIALIQTTFSEELV